MKKEEFLKELEHRLHILNDSEKEDLIEEYSQHIDIKISNGLSEEEAVADFGNIKELADEILSAYSVNLKYNRADVIGKGKNIIVKFFEARLEGIKGFLSRITQYTRRKCSTMKTYVFNKKEAKQNKCIIVNPRTDFSEEIEEKQSVLGKMVNSTKRMCKKVWKFTVELCKSIWKFTIELCKNGWKFSKYAFSLCLKIAICFALCPIALCAFFGLIGFGFALVLTFMGYPFIGITIITLGGSFILIAFSLLMIDICFNRKEKKVAKEIEYEL